MSRALSILAVCLLAGSAHAARLEPEVPALGRRALLHLESAPADSTDWPVGINAAIRATDDPKVFEFLPLRVGEVGAVLPATGDTLRFEVPASLQEVRPEFLRPIHSVGALRPAWGGTVAVVLGCLALVGAGLWFWLARRRRNRPVVEVPPEPAEIVALRELARLEGDGLVEAGRFEEFYVRGSHILRKYAGRRFELPVLDYTTTETLDSMRDAERAAGFIPRIAPLLNAADEVKFARHLPARDDGEHWLRQAREFVDATTPAPATGEPDEGDPPGGGRVAEVSA